MNRRSTHSRLYFLRAMICIAALGLLSCSAKMKAKVKFGPACIPGGTKCLVTNLDVSPSAVSLPEGAYEDLLATATFADASRMDVTDDATWNVDSATYVSLSSVTTGRVIAIAEGQSDVSAVYRNANGSGAITVTSLALAKIVVTQDLGVNLQGVSKQLHAMGIYTDGSTREITSNVEWSSASTAVVTVDNDTEKGVAALIASGSAVISATQGSIVGTLTVDVGVATLVSISVKPSSLTLPSGYSTNLSVSGTYSDGTTLDLTKGATWSSSDEAIATVDDSFQKSGYITGQSSGLVAITASIFAFSASSNVSVTSAALSSMAVLPTNPFVGPNTETQCSAVGTFSDASTLDLTKGSTWTSTDPSVIASNRYDTKGLASSWEAGSGTSTVRASWDTVIGSTLFTVTDATVQSIAVTPANLTLGVGASMQYTATATWSDGRTQDVTTSVTWSTGDSAVAVASSQGLLLGVAAGSTQVQATLLGVSGSTNLTISAAAPAVVAAVQISPSSAVISTGGTQQYSAVAVYSDGTYLDVTSLATWSSSNTGIATVSSGLVTAIGTGLATITATYDGVSGSSDSTVVTPDQAPPPSPTGLAGTANSSSSITWSWSSGGGTTVSYRYAYKSGTTAPADCSSDTNGTTSSTSVTTTGLSSSTSYTMIVCALNSDTSPDLSSPTAGATVATLQAAPPDPTGPTAVANSTSQITLSWSSGGGTTNDYVIAYQAGATAPTTCSSGSTTTASATSKAITGLSGGQYSFRICARNSNPTPDISSGVTVSGYTLPPDPTGLAAAVNSDTQITLSWTSGGGSTNDYVVAYQSGGTAPANCTLGTTSTVSVSTSAITGLTASTQYSFRVCARNANSESSSGVTVSATTDAGGLASVGPQSPTIVNDYGAPFTGYGESWTNTANTFADDGAFASGEVQGDSAPGEFTRYLVLSGFDFSTLPGGATIDGVVVGIKKSADDLDCAVVDKNIFLDIDGFPTFIDGTNLGQTTTTWSTTSAYTTYGGTSNLWGLALTVADLQSANFAVVLRAMPGSSCTSNLSVSYARIDHVRVTVYYH